MSSEVTLAGFRNSADDDWQDARDAEARVLGSIVRLGLERNAWELDVRGYTILTPDQIAPAPSTALRDRIIAIAEARHGLAIDLDAGIRSLEAQKREVRQPRIGNEATDQRLVERADEDEFRMPFGNGLFLEDMLLEGEIFERALMNEAVLALITYLLGESCYLNHMSGMIKQPGPELLEMHVDETGVPSPLPPYALTANATWLLTDYSPDEGSTCFVPGSNAWCRPPMGAEARDMSLFVPVTAPAGSVLVWGGSTWHGSLPRKLPGVRVSLLCYFARWFIWAGTPDMRERISAEALERNPRRFRRLVGLDVPAMMRGESGVATMARAAMSRYA